ncbi:Glutamine amidotransferase subunit pdxT [Deinococcus proteolyticus MRP]|uniref:Pyridoxal 5'-phosphate synthase subunit PdxT n=1 Tax=Deinococcus proteolyticus (strain ATCC 35074 / DSM 20540 / JCM 6276 / NBRC 101906 / NCIMB 13154 / VKM Ac-1939 / CCM 2703 / MRP) TaxID=693977 RepID=F0RP24_DEIPM|nr:MULTISPECIES: pyridoxal 5'-phosphate synthase glutaminase subunit PdxT [Deinococcus]ADY25339.1 Glutamine amidotransferase subunit pdxT [Deinococcus proteolyticus MRP]MCY1701461.1 pyridoxal 5'-phosphate synthase glutaminase subunit PdxT [Deinococcus sp. SL84]
MAGNLRPQVGVLALQGAFREHRQALERLGAEVREVRLPADLAGLSGVVMPGGESTTMRRLLAATGLHGALLEFVQGGGGLWGTCAGAILLARDITGDSDVPGLPPALGLLDMAVQRNAYGRQVDSFTASLNVRGLEAPFEAFFIRAPVITEVGAGVEVLAEHAGQPVAVRGGRLMATTFHPELSGDDSFHRLFLNMLP